MSITRAQLLICRWFHFSDRPKNRSTMLIPYELDNGVLRVGILNLGATITSIEMPDRTGKKGNIVAGFARPDDYLQNTAYLGCVVGRYANRIDAGRFMLDDRCYQLSVNNDGNHLHGGYQGFHQKMWEVTEE